MDDLNRIIITLGSNYNAEENIQRAVEELKKLFDSVCYSPPIYTEPYGDYPTSALFLNQVGIGTSTYSVEELKAGFKKIECLMGRRSPELKEGEMPLDIDLLQWNDFILKPEDMERDYVKESLRYQSCGSLSRPINLPGR